MSINYGTLFAQIGRNVFWSNSLLNYQNTIFLEPTWGMLDDIQNAYNANRALVANFTQSVTGMAAQMAGNISVLTQVVNNTLASLQLDLNAPSTQPSVILPLLYRQMVIDGQTVQKNVIAAPVVTPAAGNNGNGVLLCSTLNILGLTDERSLTQDVTLLCTSSQWSGGTAGAEQFSVNGWPALPSPNNYGIPGNGAGPTLTVADANNIITNGNFATFTTGVPNSWTLSAGTAVTNCDQTTSIVHSGSSALKLLGDGSTPTITLTQVLGTTGRVRAQTVYGVSVWLRKGGTVTGGSTLTVSLSGTGVPSQTLFAADPSTLTTSYVQHDLFFSTTSITPPQNYAVTINWTSANSAGASAVVYVADCVLCNPVNYGGIFYALYRGSVDPAVGDSYSVATDVLSAGVFQTYFGRWFGFQLPSSASPSISDALASSGSY